jgi:hypothetical protein
VTDRSSAGRRGLKVSLRGLSQASVASARKACLPVPSPFSETISFGTAGTRGSRYAPTSHAAIWHVSSV